MGSDEKIIQIGEKLRNKYLFNIYNDVDLVLFLQNKNKIDKKKTDKINFLINALY